MSLVHFHIGRSWRCHCKFMHTSVRCWYWPASHSPVVPAPEGDNISCVLEEVTCEKCREIGLIMTADDLAALRSP